LAIRTLSDSAIYCLPFVVPGSIPPEINYVYSFFLEKNASFALQLKLEKEGLLMWQWHSMLSRRKLHMNHVTGRPNAQGAIARARRPRLA
jgi:hypothetical protein